MKSYSQFIAESTELLEGVKKYHGEETSDVHKHVRKIMGPKHFGSFLKGMKHHVEHHPDGSSTIHVYHSSSPYSGGRHYDSESHKVGRAIDSMREGHRNDFNNSAEKNLNSKTKSHKEGYSRHGPDAPHVDIHTETKQGAGGLHHTKIHIKPSKKPSGRRDDIANVLRGAKKK